MLSTNPATPFGLQNLLHQLKKMNLVWTGSSELWVSGHKTGPAKHSRYHDLANVKLPMDYTVLPRCCTGLPAHQRRNRSTLLGVQKDSSQGTVVINNRQGTARRTGKSRPDDILGVIHSLDIWCPSSSLSR